MIESLMEKWRWFTQLEAEYHVAIYALLFWWARYMVGHKLYFVTCFNRFKVRDRWWKRAIPDLHKWVLVDISNSHGFNEGTETNTETRCERCNGEITTYQNGRRTYYYW